MLLRSVAALLLSLAACSCTAPHGATRTSDFLRGAGDEDFEGGRYEKAFTAYREAEHRLPPGSGVELRADLKYRQGRALFELHRYQEAISAYQVALDDFSAGGVTQMKAATLHALADAHSAAGESATAQALYLQALDLRRASGDTAGEIRTLVNFAQSLADTGAYAQAVRRIEMANDELRKGADVTALDRARFANLIGSIQALIGQYADAMASFRAAEIEYGHLENQESGISESLRNQGYVNIERGEFEQARESYERSIKVLPPQSVLERAKGQNGVGYALLRLGRGEEAMPGLNEAVGRLREEPQQHIELSRALESRGSAHVQARRWIPAQNDYLESLEIARRLGFVDDEREVLFSMGRMFVDRDEPRAAILYLKLAVNVSQRIRSSAATLNVETRTSLSRRLAGPYELLARLLVGQGRLAEAEEILFALKEAEYREFVRGTSTANLSPIGLTAEEERMAKDINDLGASLSKLYAQIEERSKTAPLDSNAIADLSERRSAVQDRLLAKLSEISERLATKEAQAAASLDTRDTSVTRLASWFTRNKYGDSTVVVMFVSEPRITTVLVTDASGPIALQLPVGFEKLNPLIGAFRLAIRNKDEYRPIARELHQALLAPVEVHLASRGLTPKTMMFYLTGTLRYVPFAALVDKDGRHLIEKYRLAVLTSTTLRADKTDPLLDWKVAAFGSTRPLPSENLPALAAVREELDSIVRSPGHPGGTLPGQALVDDQFTRGAWEALLNAQPVQTSTRSVIHVATHFQSKPGGSNGSFLLLGTGERYEISVLDNAASANLDDVELVTLSACSTEFATLADGKEFEGLGTVFQKKGVKAVIGTLWSVQDDGGAAMMKAFYAARGEHRKMSKAAALQDAQVQLLEGKIKSSGAAIDFTHPFYWAPFILMGNWL